MPWHSPATLAVQSQQGSQQPVEYTVWTLRITTSDVRGAGMLEDRAGVQLALVARDGRTILRRLSPLYDSEAADSDLFEICRVRALPGCCLPRSFTGLRSTTVVEIRLWLVASSEAPGCDVDWSARAFKASRSQKPRRQQIQGSRAFITQPFPLSWDPLPSR